MKKSIIAGMLIFTAMLAGCTSGDKTAFIENTSQDVRLLYDVDSESQRVDAVKIDTSGNGSEDNLASISLSADPKNNADALHFSDELKPGSFDENDYSIVVKEVSISLGEDFLINYQKVGTPKIEKSKACLESGYDIDYYYDNDKLVIYTMVKGSKQLIFNIEIRDGKYETSKGAKVGKSTRDDIYEMYGMPTDHSGTMFKYELSDSKYSLDFTFNEDGILEGIDYIDNAVM